MVKCPNCNSEVEDNSLFCQSCGTKIESMSPVQTTNNASPNTLMSFKDEKDKYMVLMGYLAVFVELIALLDTTVSFINIDRIMLYPLLSLMLVFYIAFKLMANENTYKHALIMVIASVILFIIAALAY